MFLFFHDIGFPWWAFLISFVLIILCFLLTIRGFYVLLTQTPKKTLSYLGTVFGVFLIIWLTFLLTNSDVLQTICTCFALPFGIFAGMPFLLFIEPPASIMYLGATFLNLVAVCGVIEFIERVIIRRRSSRMRLIENKCL